MITGALGQIGSELTSYLQNQLGKKNVIATDIKELEAESFDGIYYRLDVTDTQKWQEIITQNQIDEVYHLAALLSATAEKHRLIGWDLNTRTLMQLLEMAKEGLVEKVFWPSSIAVYGRGANKDYTPQHDVKNPLSMYGIAKLAGERFCEYYYQKFGVDVRSIRYPGLISWKTLPGGGTTDYAVEIYYKALQDKKYKCFLKEDTTLPMLYMDDAVRATVELMDAPKENISVRSSYNLGGLSFAPYQIAEQIKSHITDFTINYAPDYRQTIADTWPRDIDDSIAQEDWGWKPNFDLNQMTKEMLIRLKEKLAIA